MSDWKCYQLKNLGVIKTGKTPPSSCKDAFSNTGVPFVTPKDMNGVKTIFKTERYLSKIGLDSVKNYLVPKNSIAVSCIGSDMGKAYLLSEDSVTNQQINTLIVNNNHNFEFIYYKLSIMQDYLKSIAGGSATPILNKSHFSEIEIELPDLDTQNNFVEKLKYLDKKIQLNTQIPACIWLLNRNKKRKGKVLFIDARQIGYMKDRVLRDFTADDIAKIADTLHAWQQSDGYEDQAAFYKSTTLEEIKDNDFVLTPGRYVGTAEQEDDGVPFAEKMQNLTALLKEQFAKSAELEAEIKKNLEGLGYE